MFAVNISNRQIKNFVIEQINGIYDTQLNYQKTKSIDCSHNLLVSTDGFSKFHQLFSLDLSFNRINQIFQMCSALVEINLSHNKLGVVFNDFQKTLRSQGTRLYVGSFLGNLKNLQKIDLSFNEITVIASNVFENNLDLRTIILSNNNIKGSLWCFSKLEHLQLVDIGYNQLQLSDLKPLEKMKLEYLELRFNPLENTDNLDEKLQKQLHNITKIHISYGTVENLQENSTESTQGLLTSRSAISLKNRNKTPQLRTPVKQQPPKILNSKQSTPQKIMRTPTKRNLNKSPLKVSNDQKSTVKVPLLDLENSRVKQFQLEELDEIPKNILPELEIDELMEELHQLGIVIKEKKQHQISIERQVSQLKNTIRLIRMLIRGVYLYDIHQQPAGFDEVLDSLELELQQPLPNLSQIKLQLIQFNEKHAELNLMMKQLDQSQKIVDNIKQLI